MYAGALKSVQDAYALLPSLQQANGGFSYWGNTSQDVALTAYVLRFLDGAREFVEVDLKSCRKHDLIWSRSKRRQEPGLDTTGPQEARSTIQ